MDWQTRAETRLAADVVVVGGGWSALAAALAARRAGRSVWLVAAGTSLPEELTLSLAGEVVAGSEELLTAVLDAADAVGGIPAPGWLDPAIAELVVDRLLAHHDIGLVLYSTPVALTGQPGEPASGVLFGGKDGFWVAAAGAVVDATSDGVLFAADAVPFTQPPEVSARLAVAWQFAGAELSGLPAELAGCAVALRPTWPGEAWLTVTAAAPADGEVVPVALARRLRRELPALLTAVRAAVPGLTAAAVSHTSLQPWPLDGRRLAVASAAHPARRNVWGAGAWVSGSGWGDAAALVQSGRQAGAAAATGAAAVHEVTTTVRAARIVETPVLVAGGGTGGALAALAAARQGVPTTVLEAGSFLGGIGTGGGIHGYYHGVRGGLQEEIDAATRCCGEAFVAAPQITGFSPEAKKVALEAAVLEAGVDLRYGWTIVEACVEGERLVGLVAVAPGQVVQYLTQACVDATGDADLAARAGCEFAMGRDGDGLSHAYTQSGGRLAGQKISHHNFDAGYVDASDILDLTRARRDGIRKFWRDEPWTAADRLLYLSRHLGLRQSRQIVGEYTLTLADQVAGRQFADVVAYGSCHYDNHAVDYELESDEALLWCWVLGHWRRMMQHEVPYRALLPQRLDGLVMGCRALSVSHDAHMLFRMQRDMQRIGEAAGTAAALAVLDGVRVRDLALPRLHGALRASGALLPQWASALPERSPEELVVALAGDDPTLAAWQLYQQGEAAVPALRRALEAASADQRWFAAAGLAMLGHAAGAALLRDALATRDATLPPSFDGSRDGGLTQRCAPRWQAAIGLLGALSDAAAVPLLTALLAEEQPADVLIAALRALGRIGDRRAVPAIDALLARPDLPAGKPLTDSITNTPREPRDTTWQIHLTAAAALNSLGAPRPELAEAYRDDLRANVRTLARQILSEAPAARATAESARVSHSASVSTARPRPQ
ncbi:MAG: FAD-dependent oxidoreductase [Fimbriimonadaceae bacterium]|nr:FAD-dependent oxidoreductase [Fimbriimonadaceae bacterium]